MGREESRPSLGREKRRAYFFRIGAFSLINDAVAAGLRREFSELRWEDVDVERDIVRARPGLHLRAVAEAMARYGTRIIRERIPPRDFFPRLPVVLDAVREWVMRNVDPADTAFTFQTQSLFDAGRGGGDRQDADDTAQPPHFVYTDHTYLANLRYPTPRPALPVAEAWKRMERELYAGATVNFTSSRFAERSVVEDYGVSGSRVECVHSGCNIALPAAIDWSRRNGRVILFVGVDWERKGGPELVETFRKVRARFPEIELWIVGCPPAVSEQGVRVFGRLDAAMTAAKYEAADIFCLPSRMDPAASVLAEAAGYGLPVVATRVGGNVERVIDGETGFLCDADGMAEKLEELLRDGGLRRRMGEAGRAMVERGFTWDAVVGRMAERIRAEAGMEDAETRGRGDRERKIG